MGPAAAHYQAGDRARAIDTWARGAFGPAYPAALEQAVPGTVEQAVRDADILFQMEAPALQQWRFTPVEAEPITQPVLSVYHQDSVWPGFQQTHDLLVAWLPQTETVVLPQPTHVLHLVNPRGVAEALARFVARHPLAGQA